MWEIIRKNNRKSWFLFILIGIILITLGYIIGFAYGGHKGGIGAIFIACIIWAILSLISFFAGSSILLSVSNAKEITPDVHPQLFNVVEEMKIASGMPAMPKVYIINEEAPNAFATGMSPKNSAVGVTAGLLARLNRDELQGVVAHEISHIINRDVRFMTLAGIMIGCIVLISQVFLRSLWYSSAGRYRTTSSQGGGQAQLVIMIIAIVLAILAPIFARLLFFSISRKREYLADASGARLTRYPEGLASALEKIASSRIVMPSANQVTAPFYISAPLRRKGMSISRLLSTHPPIEERIRILRSMAGGANYTDYTEAYSAVTGKKCSFMPKSAVVATEIVSIRQPEKMGFAEGIKENKRAVGNIMMKVNNYSFFYCQCGLKIKVPPTYKKTFIICPRCGAKNDVQNS